MNSDVNCDASASGKIRVAINGYGVIGRRVADAGALQADMEIAGVADIVSDYRIRRAQRKNRLATTELTPSCDTRSI